MRFLSSNLMALVRLGMGTIDEVADGGIMKADSRLAGRGSDSYRRGIDSQGAA